MRKDNYNILTNIKLLYVEDEDITRNDLGIFLKKRVGKLYTACNGKEGLEKFKKFNPDIVVADLKMPVMSGVDMVIKIREINKFCPIIISSSILDINCILKIIDIGIDSYILKPTDRDKLLKVLKKSTVKILQNNYDGIVIENNLGAVDKKEKQDLERSIKNAMARFIKVNTGKGPKDVQVFIGYKQIEIKAIDILTTFQKALISNAKNNSLIEYNRKIFYEEKMIEIENMVGNIIDSKVKLKEINSDSHKNIDTLICDF